MMSLSEEYSAVKQTESGETNLKDVRSLCWREDFAKVEVLFESESFVRGDYQPPGTHVSVEVSCSVCFFLV